MGEGRNSQVVLVSQYYARRYVSQLDLRENARSPDATTVASPREGTPDSHLARSAGRKVLESRCACLQVRGLQV